MLGKEDKSKTQMKAFDLFMSLPDELIIDMLKYDREGLYIICAVIGMELSKKINF